MLSTANGVRPSHLDGPALGAVSRRLGLSEREGQIVGAILTSTKELTIARRIGMSPHTLRTHVERLYRKLRVSTRLELVVRLYETYFDLLLEPDSPLAPICGCRVAGQCPLHR